MNKCDILIIGAGAAGMTAAIYALRAKKTVILAEKATPGGQIIATTKLENYPGLPGSTGEQFAKNLRQQVESFGGKFLSVETLGISRNDEGFVVRTDDEEVVAGAVIIANGSRERRIGLPLEEELTGRGVSYCATCDGAFYKDKVVAVYGGGNTAAYSVMYLAGIAAKVYWIFRKPEPRAERHLVDKVGNIDNVEVTSSHEIISLVGSDKLTGITLKPSSSEEASNGPRDVAIDGLFVTIGREPDNERFSDFVELDGEGYIKSDESCTTSTPGVFCAGDTRSKKLHQLVTATSDGAIAANAAIDYLNQN